MPGAAFRVGERAELAATELPLDALEMALWVRQRAGQDVTGVVHHSDAGSQYTAIRYAERLSQAGALASIGSVGDSYDNAMASSRRRTTVTSTPDSSRCREN